MKENHPGVKMDCKPIGFLLPYDFTILFNTTISAILMPGMPRYQPLFPVYNDWKVHSIACGRTDRPWQDWAGRLPSSGLPWAFL